MRNKLLLLPLYLLVGWTMQVILALPAYGQYGNDARVVKSFHKSEIKAGSVLTISDHSCQNEIHAVGVRLLYAGNDRTMQNTWRYAISYSLPNGRVPVTGELKIEEIYKEGIQTYTALAVHKSNDQDYAITIEKIDDVESPEDVYVEVELYETAPMPFSYQASFNLGVRENPDKTKATLYWEYLQGAIEYELEWTFIDKYDETFFASPSYPAKPFRHREPVRITTRDQHFELPLIFEQGTVYYRVRAVGPIDIFQFHDKGVWQYGKAQDYPAAISTEITKDFEGDKNWQAVTTYAEEGKFKKIISYYDGSLRNRQTLTNLNTEQLTLAAETKYDYEGRPVVNVLPSPLKGTQLGFQPMLNLFDAEGKEFDKSNYDNQSRANSTPLSSEKGTGAGVYYSKNNPFATQSPDRPNGIVHRDYIPDAHGFPYAQVEYMNDNTGRVKSSGGVGKEFLSNGAHATRYYYGSASQEELVKLFGPNVGNASHYKRQMVVDPNGQVSVVYLDQEGRTIATALAGDTPQNLLPIDSRGTSTPAAETVDLTPRTIVDDKARTRTISSVINNVKPSSYTFNYQMTGATTQGMRTCKTCTYELNFTITDPDGVVVPYPGGVSFPITIKGTDLTSTTACTADGKNLSATYTFSKIGSYTVTKTLRLVSGDLREISETLKANGNGYSTELAALEQQYEAEAPVTDCEPCNTCTDTEQAITTAIGAVAEGECESLLKQINDAVSNCTDYNNDVTQHPEYPHYLACLKNKESGMFDRQMQRIDTWTDAESKGYVNPIGLTAGQYAPAVSATTKKDPFFDAAHQRNGAPHQLDGVSYLSAIRTALSNITYKNFTDPQAPVQILDVYTLINENEHPEFYRGLTQAQANQRKWVLFKGYYQDAKNKVRRDALVASWQNQAPYGLVYFKEGDIRLKCDAEPIVKDPADQPRNSTEADQFVNDFKQKYYQDDINDWVAAWADQMTEQCASLVRADVEASLRSYYRQIDPLKNPYKLLVADQDPGNHLLALRNQMTAAGCTTVAKDFIVDQSCGVYLDNNSPLNYLLYNREENRTNANYGTVSYNFNYIELPLASNLGSGDFTIELQTNKNPASKWLVSSDLVSMGVGRYEALKTSEPLTVQKDPVPNTDATRYRKLLELKHPSVSVPNNADGCYHVAIVRKVDAANPALSHVQMFVNGIATTPAPLVMPTHELGSNMLRLGVRASLFDPFGCIAADEYQVGGTIYTENDIDRAIWNVKVWSTARTQSELLENLNGGLAGNEPGLVGYWPLKGENNLASRIAGHSAARPVSTFDEAAWRAEAANRCWRTTVGSYESFAPPQTDPTIRTYFKWGAKEVGGCCTPGNNTAAKVSLEIPVDPVEIINNCKSEVKERVQKEAQMETEKRYEGYTKDALVTVLNECFNPPFSESLKYSFTPLEYHYTLYYYDQAGNLVQTVPPAGVIADGQGKHALVTKYRYNSLNQVVWQETPDAGVSRFWYDETSKLRLSQDAKQAAKSPNRYAYIKYDDLVRIVESGEMQASTAPTAEDINNPAFPASSARLAYVSTAYDRYPNWVPANVRPIIGYLRGRVASSEAFEEGVSVSVQTIYDYDVHGNVRALYQQLPGLDIKKIEYDYDLLSGNVNQVAYQNMQDANYQPVKDRFFHRYRYDADNRLKSVSTSLDSYIWAQDATYLYYAHGPLARMELGEYKVQGLDYTYTLQGWMKGVNNTAMITEYDPGSDGFAGHNHQLVSRDAFGFSLHYFSGDYEQIGGHAIGGMTHTGLYNGNIMAMVTSLPNQGAGMQTFETQAMLYTYDQLNRLKISQKADGGMGTEKFKEQFTYDGNGNILTLNRNDGNGNPIDQLSYKYEYNPQTGKLVKNQLLYVDDNPAYGSVSVKDQGQGNYTYDEIGNLTKDVSEGITSIEWNVAGKVRRVIKAGKSLTYTYDAAGNRVIKEFNNGSEIKTTFYVRDASGNVMAVYEKTGTADVVLTEQPIYGSSRIGVYKGGSKSFTQTLGNKQYELTNHLGNVLAVITDNKYGMDDNSDGIADYYQANLVSATDYYAFGMQMEGRGWQAAGEYRYGFNGKEKDDEWKGEGNSYDFGARIYDPRLGRFLSVDPLTRNYPYGSPYSYSANSPILYIDKNGEHPLVAWLIRNFTIGVVTDVMVQAALNYILDPNADVEKAFKDVDYFSATISGVTNTLRVGAKAKFALNGAAAVAKGYWNKGDNYTLENAVFDFLLGGGVAVVSDKIVGIIGSRGSTYVYQLFKKRGWRAGQIRELLEKVGFGRDVWHWESCGIISSRAGVEMRGNLIEDWLANTVYRNLRQTPYAHKLVDFIGDGMQVSIKSTIRMDASWVSSMTKHIDDLSAEGARSGANMILDIRVRPGSMIQDAIDTLTNYGRQHRVRVIISEFSAN